MTPQKRRPGRPKKSPLDQRTERVQVYMTAAEVDAFYTRAYREGQTASTVVRRFCQHYATCSSTKLFNT